MRVRAMFLRHRVLPYQTVRRSFRHHCQQCDQMAILLINLWPVTTMTICPVANLGQKFAKY